MVGMYYISARDLAMSKKNRGFTLIEIIITLGILSIFVLALIGSLIYNTKLSFKKPYFLMLKGIEIRLNKPPDEYFFCKARPNYYDQ